MKTESVQMTRSTRETTPGPHRPSRSRSTRQTSSRSACRAESFAKPGQRGGRHPHPDQTCVPRRRREAAPGQRMRKAEACYTIEILRCHASQPASMLLTVGAEIFWILALSGV